MALELEVELALGSVYWSESKISRAKIEGRKGSGTMMAGCRGRETRGCDG